MNTCTKTYQVLVEIKFLWRTNFQWTFFHFLFCFIFSWASLNAVYTPSDTYTPLPVKNDSSLIPGFTSNWGKSTWKKCTRELPLFPTDLEILSMFRITMTHPSTHPKTWTFAITICWWRCPIESDEIFIPCCARVCEIFNLCYIGQKTCSLNQPIFKSKHPLCHDPMKNIQ